MTRTGPIRVWKAVLRSRAASSQGGDQLVRSMALKAMELSKQRAAAVRTQMIDQLKVDPARIEMVGRGWEEPLGGQPDLNRRVEVQWFTLE